MTKQTTVTAEAKASAIAFIGDAKTISTIVRTVSASGMSRTMSAYIVKNGEIACIDHHITALKAGSARAARNGVGFTVSGCGMDMGFHVVYSLSQTLYGKSDTLKQTWI